MKTSKHQTKKLKKTQKMGRPPTLMAWFNILTMASLSKTTYRFIAIPNKIPMQFFTDFENNNLKIHMGTQKILGNPDIPEQ